MHATYMPWVQRFPHCLSQLNTGQRNPRGVELGATSNQQSSEADAKSPDKLAILLKSLEQLLFQLGLLCG